MFFPTLLAGVGTLVFFCLPLGVSSARNITVEDSDPRITYFGPWNQGIKGTNDSHRLSSGAPLGVASFRFKGGSRLYYVAPGFPFQITVNMTVDPNSNAPRAVTMDLQDRGFQGQDTIHPTADPSVRGELELLGGNDADHLVEITAGPNSLHVVVDQFIITLEDEDIPRTTPNPPAAPTQSSPSPSPESSPSSTPSRSRLADSQSSDSGESESHSDTPPSSSSTSTSSPTSEFSSPTEFPSGKDGGSDGKTANTNDPPSRENLSVAAAAAIGAISSILGLILILALIWLCSRRRRAARSAAAPPLPDASFVPITGVNPYLTSDRSYQNSPVYPSEPGAPYNEYYRKSASRANQNIGGPTAYEDAPPEYYEQAPAGNTTLSFSSGSASRKGSNGGV